MRTFHFDVLNSTNDYMKEHKKDFQEYDVVMADNQTAGKGRRGNIWISTEGMALFTFLIKKREEVSEEEYMRLPLIVGLSVIRALRKIENVNYQFKWTNDIYLEGKKLAGILIERQENNFFIGIGLNLNNVIPMEIKHIAISLHSTTGKQYSREEVIEKIVEESKKGLEEYFHGAWKEQLSEINALHCLQGKAMALRAGNLFVSGQVTGINEAGELEILSRGEKKSFGIGEVVRQRILLPLEAKVESLVKAYILKEANYDVIGYIQGELSAEWEEKIQKLQLRIERNMSLEELKEKYRAESLEEIEELYPLTEYSKEQLEEIAKIFAKS